MKVTPIKTRKVQANAISLFELLDESLSGVKEGSVIAITSKVVSLCEGSFVPASVDKEQLIKDQSQYYLAREESQYGHRFTVTNNTLIASAGIDMSNADGVYVLWPKDSAQTANEVRAYLRKKYNLHNLGIIITDSTCRPMRLGASGIALGFSGFKPLHRYADQEDLFGRRFMTDTADILNGLAGAAVVTMGEGAEQTPLTILEDLPFVEFKQDDPSQEDLATLNLTIETDLFSPFLNNGKWQK